jgi:hypothetical protein
MKPNVWVATGLPLPEPPEIKPEGWTLLSGLILLVITVLPLARWPAYPPFLDSYYHLSVLQGFRDAGGPTLHAFWETAPEGRAHLYPPLFHLLYLPIHLLGLPLINLARLWCTLSMPILAWTAWRVFSLTVSARLCALILLSLITPFSFFLSTLNHPPATLALTAGLGILLAVVKNRWLAGGGLLALAFSMPESHGF